MTTDDLRKLTQAVIANEDGSNNDYQLALDNLSDELTPDCILALLDVIDAAKAIRNAGVSVGQCVVLPDSDIDSMSEDHAIGEFIAIFDGPLQRAFDAALAALEQEEK